MNTQHTSPPWIIDDGFQRQEDLIAALTMDLEVPDRHWCAIGIADNDGFAESVAYCHPVNAPLVSASPELLAALRKCSALLDAAINNGRCGMFADATGGPMGNVLTPAAEARAAILKATTPLTY